MDREELLKKFKFYIEIELGLADATCKAYLHDAAEFLSFVPKNQEQLTAHILERFVKFLGDKGLQSSTIHRKCMSVRSLYNCLIGLGELDKDILDCVDPPGQGSSIPKPIASSDLYNILTTHVGINKKRNKAMVLLIAHSGLRASELCDLKIQDLSVEKREVKVRGKGSQDRIVPVSHEFIQAVNEYLATRTDNLDDLFLQESGDKRMSRHAVSSVVKSMANRAGIQATAHSLRTSFATNMMNNGADLQVVQQILGHKHLSTTERYLAVTPEHLKKVFTKCHPSVKWRYIK